MWREIRRALVGARRISKCVPNLELSGCGGERPRSMSAGSGRGSKPGHVRQAAAAVLTVPVAPPAGPTEDGPMSSVPPDLGLVDWCADVPAGVMSRARELAHPVLAQFQCYQEESWRASLLSVRRSRALAMTCEAASRVATTFDMARARPTPVVTSETNAEQLCSALLGALPSFISFEAWVKVGASALSDAALSNTLPNFDEVSLDDPRFDWGPWSGPALRVAWDWAIQRHCDIRDALRLAGVETAACRHFSNPITLTELLVRPGVLIDALSRVCGWTPSVGEVSRLNAQIARELLRGFPSGIPLPASINAVASERTSGGVPADYRDAAWICHYSEMGLDADRIRKMRERGTLRQWLQQGSRYLYSVPEIAEARHEYAALLLDALAEKLVVPSQSRKRTKADKGGQGRTRPDK